MARRDGITRVVARGLFKAYGSTVALRGVDASFESGQLTIIEGANGSGKSTLLGIIGTVIRPPSGEMRYKRAGSTGEVDRQEVRGTLGWLSHETLAYADLSERQNIEL